MSDKWAAAVHERPGLRTYAVVCGGGGGGEGGPGGGGGLGGGGGGVGLAGSGAGVAELITLARNLTAWPVSRQSVPSSWKGLSCVVCVLYAVRWAQTSVVTGAKRVVVGSAVHRGSAPRT